jgi:hypothetical protein
MAWTDRVQDDVSTGAEAMARVRAMRAKFGRVTKPTTLMPAEPAKVPVEAAADHVPVALFFDAEPQEEAETSPEPNAEPAEIVPEAMPVLARSRIRIEVILRVVSRYYGVTVPEVIGPDRARTVTIPRQAAMRFASLEGWSFPEIGRRIGGRDHTTVLHGARSAAARMTRDAACADAMANIAKLLETVRAEGQATLKRIEADLLDATIKERLAAAAERDRRTAEREQARWLRRKAEKDAAAAARANRTPEQIEADRAKLAAANAARLGKLAAAG